MFPGLPHLQREFTACKTAARAVKATEKNDSKPCKSRVTAVTKDLRKPERRKGFCAPTVSEVTVHGPPALLLLGSRTMWWIEAAHPMMERRRLGTECTLL